MKKKSVDLLFTGSGSFVDAPKNSVGTIFADEAHRLNEKSGLYQNKGENQIKEIIHAANCSVFFIDESQRVTISDIGSIAEIEKWADEENSKVVKMKLVSQFRCNGSDGYLAWLDNVLGIRDTANYDLDGIDYDIKIGDYEISWNLDGGDAFAIDQKSVNEARCIHTSQGFEFDYVGVIIGDDMRYQNGRSSQIQPSEHQRITC